MSELDKIFLPLVGTFIIGVLTWFLNTLLKLRQEFDTHREGKGHKLLVDAFYELEKDFLARVAELDKRIEINLTRIDNIQGGLKELAGTTKYNLRSVEDRLALIEKILESNGYLIFGSLKRPKQAINKDTFTKVEEMEEGDID